MEKVSECPMVVAGGFESDPDGAAQAVQEIGEGAKLLRGVLNPKSLPVLPSRRLD
jgi:hypothetical protein